MEYICYYSALGIQERSLVNKDRPVSSVGEPNQPENFIVLLIIHMEVCQKDLGPEPGFIFYGGLVDSFFYLDFPCVPRVVSGKYLQSVAARFEVCDAKKPRLSAWTK